jgi:hypothetical protein
LLVADSITSTIQIFNSHLCPFGFKIATLSLSPVGIQPSSPRPHLTLLSTPTASTNAAHVVQCNSSVSPSSLAACQVTLSRSLCDFI